MVNKRREKRNVGIIVTAVFLVMAVAVLAYLNAGNVEGKKELEAQAEFLLAAGSREFRVARQDLVDLQPQDFAAVLQTSTTGPTTLNLTGVELRQLLAVYKIALTEGSTLEVHSLDGYTSIVSGAEVLEEDNVYICISLDGEPLKTRKEGGWGPYLLVLKNVQYAQRWCKFLEKIIVR